MKKLFSERQGAVKPRTAETLDDVTRAALINLLRARIDEEWFGLSFPYRCDDQGYDYAGTSTIKLKGSILGYGLAWPVTRDEQTVFVSESEPSVIPSDGQLFDLIEFAYEFIAEPVTAWHHSYVSHTHYTYDRDAGREKFTHDVNRIFERNGMAFELRDGEVVRTLPAVAQDVLAGALFRTGDAMLDELLETARNKFLNRSLEVRREALEALWDAWERLKTVEPGSGKAQQVKALLDKASGEPSLRQRIEDDARALTDIGNDFTIRHKETNRIPVAESHQVDYFFHRMFALVLLLLRASGRG